MAYGNLIFQNTSLYYIRLFDSNKIQYLLYLVFLFFNYYLKQFLNLNIFDRILPFPTVHPDLSTHPTLSFSKNKWKKSNTTTKCPKPWKQNTVSPKKGKKKSPNKKHQNPPKCKQIKTHMHTHKSVGSVICWSVTEHKI